MRLGRVTCSLHSSVPNMRSINWAGPELRGRGCIQKHVGHDGPEEMRQSGRIWNDVRLHLPVITAPGIRILFSWCYSDNTMVFFPASVSASLAGMVKRITSCPYCQSGNRRLCVIANSVARAWLSCKISRLRLNAAETVRSGRHGCGGQTELIWSGYPETSHDEWPHLKFPMGHEFRQM
ncbi:hypothetical protein BDV59DRAFT_166685 [Aspergillus ambiguus]|uniref:uncharacterized protein n=1 Tax=Aspergillus ambiguus TaxID=176160 RepID=UPI003CCCD3B6